MKLLIHIGYPKTGSSWLQKYIFNNESLGLSAPWGREKQAPEALTHFIYPDDLSFSPSKVSSYFLPTIESTIARELVPVFSHEYLSVRIAAISYPRLVADRLATVFPQAKILMFIREQKSMLLSTYQEYIKNQGIQTLEEALDENNYPYGNIAALRPSLYKYDLLISYYQHLFGRDNVLVIPFEMFKMNNLEVVGQILDFVGTEYNRDSLEKIEKERSLNPSYELGGLPIRRKISQIVGQLDIDNSRRNQKIIFLNRVNKVINKLLPESLHQQQKKYLKQVIDDNIKDIYQESNRKTSELIGIDLAEFGYFI